jgi:hypothetical protein
MHGSGYALVLSLAAFAVAPADAQPALAAGRAPFFSLETVEQTRRVESDTLFAGASATVLAFWTTHCSECVHRLEACQALQDWGRDDGLAVVGVNFDETPSAKIQLLARQATPGVTQLYDAGGRVASEYGAGAHSFSVFVIDATGVLRTTRFDAPPESIAALELPLRALMDETLGEEEPAPSHPGVLEELGRLRQQRLEAHGIARVRWMSIDTTGTGATGAFGEAVEPGSTLRHRMELELVYSITPQLRAGGLVWLSNEGPAVLRSGPDYLSTAWGSAFVRCDAQSGGVRTSLRAGYYDAYFTPLTLMRWDKDDSPISGGQRVQGCGCSGQAGPAGFIRSESLERLEPKYRFEGGRWDVSLAERVDLVALYARPLVAYPDDPTQCGAVAATDRRYHQELYAGRLTAQLSVPWGNDAAALSGTVLGTRDFTKDWPCPGSLPPYDPGRARVLGADLRLPLPLRAQATAEITRSRWAPDSPAPIEGTALRAGCSFDIRPRDDLHAVVDLSYQHLGADFFSPYSALSYEANLRPSRSVTRPGLAGARGSLRIDWGSWGVGAFVKALDPVDGQARPGGEVPLGEWRLGSVWLDNEIWPGGVVSVGWITDQRRPLASQTLVGTETRRTWIADIQQRLAPRCLLLLEAEFLHGDAGRTDAYDTRTVRAMVDVAF